MPRAHDGAVLSVSSRKLRPQHKFYLLLAALCTIPLTVHLTQRNPFMRVSSSSHVLTTAQQTLSKSPPLSVQTIPTSELLSRTYASHIIVSEKLRAMYCPVAKAANTNWKYLIRKLEGQETYAEVHLSHNRDTSGLRYLSDYSTEEAEKLLKDASYFKFSFVRDPYTRSLSAYMDKFRNVETGYTTHDYRVFLAEIYGWQHAHRTDIFNAARPSFREFVDEIVKQDPKYMNAHWMPQSILCGFGEMPYDYIGRMERLPEHTAYILRKLNATHEKFPSHTDVSFPASGAQTAYAQDHYSLDILFKLRALYALDFQLLGY